MEYYPLPDGTYAVGGGTAKYMTEIVIPATHKGKAVTVIQKSAFANFPNLTSITISDSVTSIGDFAFYYCMSLKSITFKGTKAQWNAILMDYDWNNETGPYTVHCTDGDIAKS